MAKLILTGRILGILWTTASWSSTEESIQVVKINNKYHEKRAFFLNSLDNWQKVPYNNNCQQSERR